MSTDENDRSRHIPADIRRAVLLEEDHSCSIPTCRYPATEFANIEPFSRVRTHEASKIIALCPNHHQAFDQKRTIDRKAMKVYTLKLQFLNERHTKYELTLLTLLAEKPAVVASGEIETMNLLMDGLIENCKTFLIQSIEWIRSCVFRSLHGASNLQNLGKK